MDYNFSFISGLNIFYIILMWLISGEICIHFHLLLVSVYSPLVFIASLFRIDVDAATLLDRVFLLLLLLLRSFFIAANLFDLRNTFVEFTRDWFLLLWFDFVVDDDDDGTDFVILLTSEGFVLLPTIITEHNHILYCY